MDKIFSKFRNKNIDEQNDVILIVGLGNPGRDYKNNRHNIGFMVVSEIAKKLGVEFSRMQNKSLVTKANYEGKRIILAKPQTFMNLSGQAVSSLCRFYKIPNANLIILFDDVDIPFETLRLRAEGGSSGQKGMKSIIQSLGTQHIPRLRIGIDRPPGKMRTPDYVLQDFSKSQSEFLPWVMSRAADAALLFVAEGINSAMSKFNQIEK